MANVFLRRNSRVFSATPGFIHWSSKQLMNELRKLVEIDICCATTGCFRPEDIET